MNTTNDGHESALFLWMTRGTSLPLSFIFPAIELATDGRRMIWYFLSGNAYTSYGPAFDELAAVREAQE